MMTCARILFASVVLPSLAWSGPAPAPRPSPYPWLETIDPDQALARRIPPPAGFERAPAEADSFAHWLRNLPLKPGRPPVLLFNGKPKSNQDVHAAVVDIDVGSRDLQQCADAVIRLRAEYLFFAGDHAAIHFNFTSGDRADYAKWKDGFRPTVRGNAVSWASTANADDSYRGFRRYLDVVFTYAGTLSLSRELKPVADRSEMQIGDVFIQGGSPGHVVLVADLAVHRGTGRTCFLLVQSYMPAQDIHVLQNPTTPALGPWYAADFGEMLRTPEWTFKRGDLRRF
jgi:hypothetical protein